LQGRMTVRPFHIMATNTYAVFAQLKDSYYCSEGWNGEIEVGHVFASEDNAKSYVLRHATVGVWDGLTFYPAEAISTWRVRKS